MRPDIELFEEEIVTARVHLFSRKGKKYWTLLHTS